MSRVLALVVLLALASPVAALGQGSRVSLADTVPSGKSTYICFETSRRAAFRVWLRVPATGRAQLFLLGRHAPKGGPLITTSPARQLSACQGATGFFICRASYESLPAGAYVWRIRWTGPRPAYVELTVRW